ncbi:hypothetical protein GCM10022232_79090 [Streptomyces plumbiresistens]|uniref:Uncharacterized protein n=1 Tax=Streptomyces plumbiresistens TaxID=511811 RepID=A0ABP7T7S0_9ACTN
MRHGGDGTGPAGGTGAAVDAGELGRLGVSGGDDRGSDAFTPPCKGAAGAPAARRKVGWSSEGTSEGGAG